MSTLQCRRLGHLWTYTAVQHGINVERHCQRCGAYQHRVQEEHKWRWGMFPLDQLRPEITKNEGKQ